MVELNDDVYGLGAGYLYDTSFRYTMTLQFLTLGSMDFVLAQSY